MRVTECRQDVAVPRQRRLPSASPAVTECRQDVAVPRQRRLPSASPAATHHRALPDAPVAFSAATDCGPENRAVFAYEVVRR